MNMAVTMSERTLSVVPASSGRSGSFAPGEQDARACWSFAMRPDGEDTERCGSCRPVGWPWMARILRRIFWRGGDVI